VNGYLSGGLSQLLETSEPAVGQEFINPADDVCADPYDEIAEIK